MKRSRRSVFAITVVCAVLILAAAEIHHARTVSSELEAQAHIRMIHNAQLRFFDQHGRYATTFSELGVPESTEGYKFALASSKAGYAVSADPKIFNSTGRRTFFSDQTRTIHQNWGQQPASAGSPALMSNRFY